MKGKFLLMIAAGKRSWFSVFCCICLFVSGYAQSMPVKDSILREQKMSEVVITGQYAPNPAEKAVQKIKVIDRAKMDAMAAQNLRDVLSNEMNIRLSQDNILGSSMSMQGLSGENVKILVDGVPVIGRQDGNLDLSQINLNNVERIEIIEGPMSVNYGSNALAGTINLVTNKNQSKFLRTGLSSYYESIGTYNSTASIGLHKNAHTLLLNGGRNFFDGWSKGDKVSVDIDSHIADSSRFRQWKPRTQYFADAQYIYRYRNTTFNYKGSYFNETIVNKGLPRIPYGETAFDDYYHTTRIDNALFVNSTLRETYNINFLAAYNIYKRVKNTYYNDLTTLNETLSTNTGDQDTTQFTLFNSRATFSSGRKNVKLNYEAGYDINVESGNGVRISGQKKEIGDYALFASAEYIPMQQVTIRPGLRYSYNTVYAAPLVPSLHIRYKMNNNLVLRASYAKGFRAPSLKDLYFYFVDINHNIRGNDQLKAEHADNYNLSANYSNTFRSLIYKAELGTFYNDVQNLITLAQVSGAEYSYINIGKYKTMGLQANTTFIFRNLKYSLGASYSGMYNQLSETNNVDAFSYTPEFRSNISYSLLKNKLLLSLFYKYTGRIQAYALDASNNIQQTYIEAYSIADASLSKTFFEKKLSLTFGCKNIFDVTNLAATVSGAVHTSGGDMPLSTGRSFFIKADINIEH